MRAATVAPNTVTRFAYHRNYVHACVLCVMIQRVEDYRRYEPSQDEQEHDSTVHTADEAPGCSFDIVLPYVNGTRPRHHPGYDSVTERLKAGTMESNRRLIS
jgi:hypothetical protein